MFGNEKRRKAFLRLFATASVFIFFTMMMIMIVPGDAAGADYDFDLMREEATVKIRTDGQADITYAFEFLNYGNGLDVVDVGMPNEHYRTGTAKAHLKTYDQIGNIMKNKTITSIRTSEFVNPGVEVHINAGSDHKVVLEFSITCGRMVWESPNNKDMASVEFRPTWFGSQYQRGDTKDLIVNIILPETVPDLTYTAWQNREWDEQEQTNDGWKLTWYWGSQSPWAIERGNCDVGVAFDKQYVDKYYVETFWMKLTEWIKSVCTLLCSLSYILIPLSVVVGVLVFSLRKNKDYFRPGISMPGAGPRTGLTAPEAAMVMELPLNKVLAFILYGMIKKGALSQKSLDPPMFRWEDKKLLTHPYETDVFDALEMDGTFSTKQLEEALVEMVKATEKKLTGFSQRKTKQYYKRIVDQAWENVKLSQDPDALEAALIKNDEWLPLANDFDKRMDLHVFPIFIHHPSYGGRASGSYQVGGMARAYVANINTLSKNVVSSTSKITSHVVNTLHPPSSGGSSGGFSGGGCACACACACAGGGR